MELHSTEWAELTGLEVSTSNHTLGEVNSTPEVVPLIERLVERENMKAAYSRVIRNKGAAGVDKMPVEKLGSYLKENWPQIKEQLLDVTYIPKPVKRIDIPKPGGGTRQLGVPTVLDRLIQQAIQRVLSPTFEPTFSKSSYGFRPEVNHDIFMSRVAKEVKDKKIPLLIRRYLQAGIMFDGITSTSEKGTPSEVAAKAQTDFQQR